MILQTRASYNIQKPKQSTILIRRIKYLLERFNEKISVPKKLTNNENRQIMEKLNINQRKLELLKRIERRSK